MSSGAIKHLATPKTMNVPEVTSLYECLRTVSIKNKELFDDAVEILGLSPLHPIIKVPNKNVAFYLSMQNL